MLIVLSIVQSFRVVLSLTHKSHSTPSHSDCQGVSAMFFNDFPVPVRVSITDVGGVWEG